MKHPKYIALVIIAGLIPVFVSASIILEHSYEANSVGAGVTPSEMGATGAFGDQDNTFFGISSTAPRTGSLHYFIDQGDNGGGSGFGGTFSVANETGLLGTLTSSSQYTVSAWFRNDAADPFTGGGEVNVHLEFYDNSNVLIFRTDNVGLQALLLSGDVTTSYQQLENVYTLNNIAHIPDPSLVARVAGVVTGSNGGNTSDGRVFVDDFAFSNNAVPEPSSLALIGLSAVLMLLRRRTSRCS